MLSLIVEQLGVGVAVVDNEANFLYANPTFATMQLRTAGYKGSIFYDPSEWNGRVQSLMHDTIAAGVGRAEVIRRRLDGTTFAAHVTLSLLRDKGEHSLVEYLPSLTSRSVTKPTKSCGATSVA
jgi:PAS domain-containing protein